MRQRTWIFCLRSRRTTWLPIKPVAPVTNARMDEILNYFRDGRGHVCAAGGRAGALAKAGAIVAVEPLEHAEGQEREIMPIVRVFQIKHFREARAGELLLIPGPIGALGV